MVRAHHDNEVEHILDDIRDTLAPQRNPDCTFITRRNDKRLQERLLDLSTTCEDTRAWSGIVFSRDQEQTAVGWQDVIPYPKYVDKRAVPKEPAKRARHTNPVDNSTIVRHLQERIRKWANRKPNHCLYGKRSYSTQSGKTVPASYPAQSKVALISSVELPVNVPEFSDQQSQTCLAVRRTNSVLTTQYSNDTAPDKLPVSWNLLSQNDATHLNLQTYGMDPYVTYVPARRQNSHINNYTASKQIEHQQRAVAKQQAIYGGYGGRVGGVLHPARTPKYTKPKRQTGFLRSRKQYSQHPEDTIDITEEAESEQLRDKFKCSICIEGLQVADWPTYIEYNSSDPSTTGVGPARPGHTTSDCLTSYKMDKASPTEPDTQPNTSLAVITGEPKVIKFTGTGKITGQLYHGPTPIASHRGGGEPGGSLEQHPVQSNNNVNNNKLIDLKLKQLVIKERVSPSVMRAARLHSKEQSDKKQNKTSSSQPGNSSNQVYDQNKKRHSKKADFIPSTGLEPPTTLYDRYQATKLSGKKKRKMYGVSICDVYESKQDQPDVFSYGLFLASPLGSPPSKQKLDPLIKVKPVNCNLKGH